jgi:hypothetical protein
LTARQLVEHGYGVPEQVVRFSEDDFVGCLHRLYRRALAAALLCSISNGSLRTLL